MACVEALATVHVKSGIEQLDRDIIFCYGRAMVWGDAADAALNKYEMSGFKCLAYLRNAEYCVERWAEAEIELELLERGILIYLEVNL